MRLTVVLSAAVAGVLVGAVAAWIDPTGQTILTDSEEPPVEGAVRVDPEQLAAEWEGTWLDEPLAGGSDSSRPEDRMEREVRGALDELTRGDPAGAIAVVRRLHDTHPNRPELAIALAEAERQRGRLEPAREILSDLLLTPAGLAEPWRSRARRVLREIDDEIETAELDGNLEARRAVDTGNFVLTYDHRLAGRTYGEQVSRLVEGIRSRQAKSLGRTLDRKLEIRLYTRRQYLDAYEHRFGFATVGFFDGAIHVVTARHPRGQLEALLAHEYAHALFEDALGGHRPFFLNEGIAEREEERVRGRTGIVRAEWWKLLEAVRLNRWIPLGTLVEGFGSLQGPQALLAYLESRAAVELLEAEHPGVLGRWLERSAAGQSWERVLVEETGWDVAALDGALRDDIRARFPDSSIHAANGSQSSGVR